MAAARNGITLTGLCKEYRLGKTTVRALRGVDLEIASGSFTCIAGPSGSGKTTLLNLIGLIDAPTSGTVHVAGEDIQGLPEKLRTRYRSRTLGFIFQSFNLLPVLSEHIRHKPFELSGGQRQRVAIARALVTHPLIVLADEPTANLDSETGAEVLALMEGINRDRGTTFIFSSHDPRVMEHASRVIRLHDGCIEAA